MSCFVGYIHPRFLGVQEQVIASIGRMLLERPQLQSVTAKSDPTLDAETAIIAQVMRWDLWEQAVVSRGSPEERRSLLRLVTAKEST